MFGINIRTLPFKVGFSRWILTLILMIGVLALLVAYVFRLGNVRIDETTLILIGVLLLIPQLDLVRRIKIGNFFEAEITTREIAEVRSNSSTKSNDPVIHDEVPDSAYSEIADILQQDMQLGFAKLRIEIEGQLRGMHSKLEPNEQQRRPLALG